MLHALPEAARQSLAAAVPFPNALGQPAQYAALVLHIIENRYLNGEVDPPRRRPAHGAALISPPPCGEGQGWGWRGKRECVNAFTSLPTPTLPSPQGGG